MFLIFKIRVGIHSYVVLKKELIQIAQNLHSISTADTYTGRGLWTGHEIRVWVLSSTAQG